MNYAFYALGFIAFIAAILISISLHELGHLIPAKKFGAKVTQYFVGFGKTVWSRKKGETEYGVKLIPLGGFVRIVGMMPPVETTVDEHGREVEQHRNTNTGMFTSIIHSAKKTEYEGIPLEDRNRLFYQLPWWKKFIVMAGGPMVNLALAFLCFMAVFNFYGERKVDVPPGPVALQHVSKCTVGEYGQDAKDCAAEEYSAAHKAGLRPGDSIVAVEGTPVKNWEQLYGAIQGSPDEALGLTIAREGVEQEVIVTPTALTLKNESGTPLTFGFLGVQPKYEAVLTDDSAGLTPTLVYMQDLTVETFKTLSQIPVKAYNVFKAIIGIEERDPNGPISIVGGARISGEVAAYEGDNVVYPQNWSDKIASFFLLVGGFNLFLGVFNLIPLPPLDGAHMMGALWEGMKRGFSKVFRRAEPKPADIAKLLPLAYFFGLSLFALGALLIVGDIVVPIRLIP